MSEQRAPEPQVPLSRRGLLKSALAAAVVATPALTALAEAATKPKGKPAPKPTPAAPAKAGPDFSVCKTAEERTALERQWKQMVDTVDSLHKTPLPVGSEFATRALAPKRLRRGEA